MKNTHTKNTLEFLIEEVDFFINCLSIENKPEGLDEEHKRLLGLHMINLHNDLLKTPEDIYVNGKLSFAVTIYSTLLMDLQSKGRITIQGLFELHYLLFEWIAEAPTVPELLNLLDGRIGDFNRILDGQHPYTLSGLTLDETYIKDKE